MIAILYAYPDGPYSLVEDVDIWGEERDARRYAGPHAVVAHPPCERWWGRCSSSVRLDAGFHSAAERQAAKAAGWTEP